MSPHAVTLRPRISSLCPISLAVWPPWKTKTAIPANRLRIDLWSEQPMFESISPSDFRITYIGHAGFAVDAGDISILIDPWFYAANLGSIFPYPDNSFVLPDVTRRKFDYLYISHAHTDHFDRRLLDQLDKDVTVLCPSFRSRELEVLMKGLGFSSLIKLGHLESLALSERLSVTMLLDSSAAEDSGLMIEFDGFRFLDLNDCQVNMSELPRADVLACQFSGAIHYPQTYDIYTLGEKAQKAEVAIGTY
ncbi:MAG: MBL fold metallo-hydrolase, partial [Verrucomicrobiaceae bacterium]